MTMIWFSPKTKLREGWGGSHLILMTMMWCSPKTKESNLIFILFKNMFCAGAPRKDSCQGDSGGRSQHFISCCFNPSQCIFTQNYLISTQTSVFSLKITLILSGPLFLRVDGRFTQIGIVSWGFGCADVTPGVYTNIANLMPWIQRILAYY